MHVRKHRWSRDYESAEEELANLLAAKHIEAQRWLGQPDEEIAAHTHNTDTRIWCVEGSIKFTIDGKQFSLQPGDTLDIPAAIVRSAVVGFTGCVCYEAPIQS